MATSIFPVTLAACTSSAALENMKAQLEHAKLKQAARLQVLNKPMAVKSAPAAKKAPPPLVRVVGDAAVAKKAPPALVRVGGAVVGAAAGAKRSAHSESHPLMPLPPKSKMPRLHGTVSGWGCTVLRILLCVCVCL